MKVEQDSYEDPIVDRIIAEVRAGRRCKAALRVLGM